MFLDSNQTWKHSIYMVSAQAGPVQHAFPEDDGEEDEANWSLEEIERRPYAENHSTRLLRRSSCITRGAIFTNFTLTPLSITADNFRRTSAPRPALSR